MAFDLSPLAVDRSGRARRCMSEVARIAGALVLAIGLLVLLGWQIDSTLLKSIRPDFVSMKPNSATAFVLAGLALLLRRDQGARSFLRDPTVLVPLAVALVGLLTLLEYTLGVDARIDELLFRDRGSVATSSPGRMAPLAALSFLFMGASLVLLRRSSLAAARVAQGLTLVVLLFCFLSLVGYLYGARALYGVARHTHIAPHTLVASLLLGIGILASRPDVGLGRLLASDSAGGVLLRRMLPICIVLPIGLGWLRLWGQQRGLYDTQLGLVLFATANVVVISAFSTWVADNLTRQHDRRLAAERALLQAKEELEVRVAERTQELADAKRSVEQRNLELVRVQESLRRSEEMYRTLMGNLPNSAVLLFDHELRYQLADGAKLLAALGVEREQVVGKSFFEIARPETGARLEALYRAALRGETDELEVVRSGHTLAVHSAPVYGDDGAVASGMLFVYDVTALKQAQAAAQRSEERFQRLVEAMPDIVTVIRDERFVYVNPAAVKALGYHAASELLGTSVLGSVTPDEQSDLASELAAASRGRLPPGTGLRAGRRRDGTEFLAEYIILPMEFEGQSAIVSIAKDVTERYRAEVAAREATSLWRAILDSANYTMIATTPEGVIREFNVAAERMLGYAAGEVVGKLTPAILHEPAEVVARAAVLSAELGEPIAPGFDVFVAKARRGTSDENEWTYIRKDGSRFPVRLSVTALRDSGGRVSGFLGIGSDITEHKRAREELVRAKDTAEQAMRARADFLARMSHEIRTPMNGVLGMTGLALETALDREQREYIETARSSAHSLLSLINDILDFSKIDAGKLVLERIPYRPRTCLRDSLRTLAGQAHAKGLELLIEIAPDVPAGLVGDPQRVQQIVTNLVANAVKFTDKGDVTVRVTVRDLNGAGGGTLAIEVADTGIGIPRDKQAAIFEAFSQADEAITRRFGGTGLGLSICSQLVALMGGKLRVESELGRGSVFVVTLPMAVDPEARPDSEAEPFLRGLPVLVVDDHPAQRQILSRLLGSWHMRPVTATQFNAVEAVREAQRKGQPFRLILLDSVLTDVDSYELGARIRAECVEAPSFILLGTAIGLAAQPSSSPLGHPALVMKPVAASSLLETVQAVLTGGTADGHDVEITPAPRAKRPSLRVLVADDNAVNRRLATRVLETAGHEVVTVDNGRRALTALAQGAFDVVLMDVQMPEMDGIEATRVLRASEGSSGRHMPVIALTAQAMKGDRDICLAAGMDSYVSKPLDKHKLLAAMDEVTRGRPEPAPTNGAAASADVGTPTVELAFDREHMLSRIGDDTELMQEIVALFRGGLPKLLQALDSAIAAAEPSAVARAAHTLRGALLNLSARPAARIAQDLEEHPVFEVAEAASLKVAALRTELGRLEAMLEQSVTASAPAATAAPGGAATGERSSA